MYLSSYWFPLYVLARCLVYTSASVGPQQWAGSFIVSLVRTEGIVSLYLPSEPLKRIWVVDEIKYEPSQQCAYGMLRSTGQVRSGQVRVFNVHIQSKLL